MSKKAVAIITLLSVVGLLAMMQVTSPSEVHPLGILLVFIFIYAGLVGLLAYFIWGLGWAARRFNILKSDVSFTSSYLLSTAVALAPVMIIGMKSVGSMNFFDLVLILLFELILCFFLIKR